MVAYDDDKKKDPSNKRLRLGAWIMGLCALVVLVMVVMRPSSTEAPAQSPELSKLEVELAAEKQALMDDKLKEQQKKMRKFLNKNSPPKPVADKDFEAKISEFKQLNEDKATALRPMWNLEHQPSKDVVMALGFGYSRREFSRFVSTLRRTSFDGDIILATEPEERMKNGVADYLRQQRVLCYGFEYTCVKKKSGRRLLVTPAGCQLTNWYAKGDARGPRPLALARYEMYRSWLLEYMPEVWGIVFDFRDTYFQRDPFSVVDKSPSAPNLHLFAENRKVKTVGNCVFNSGWLRCWGKQTPKIYANKSVVCSGSTMGTRDALFSYVERMIVEFDKMKCHMTPARTESDQGYHNFLFDSGALAELNGVKVTYHEQGYGGLVNTIGAMNGFRVPKHMKGPLDTFWKIRDKDGYLLEYDGSRSAVIHQWDRFHPELVKFIDQLVADYHTKSNRLA